MRKTWVAILGVFMISLFAGTSYATAPVVDDVPDIRLMTGVGVVDDFDLSNYVTDYDDAVAGLTYTVESAVGFDSSPTTGITGSLLDIGGSSSDDQGTLTLRVTDASSDYSEDDCVVKYSSLMLIGPSLTEDNNLVPPNSFARTLVLEADAAITSTAISALISPQSASGATLYVSIADLDGDCQAGNSNATSVSYGDLAASISGSGELVLQAAGSLTGTYQLSGAYRVGVKAKLTGGGLAGAEDNWDGMELLASISRFPTRYDANTAARLDKFNNFSGVPTGALVVGYSALKALADADSPRWYKVNGTGVTEIVASAPASGTATWATSGQALKITLASASDTAFIQSEWFTDIQPGETVTFAANVSTNAALGAEVGNMVMFMGNFHMPSNYEGLAIQQGAGAATKAPQLPTGGSSGWKTIKATLVADAVGAAVVDAASGGTVNFYEKGYQCAIAITGGNGAPTYPFEVYIDNVRVYRDEKDIDKALGSTVIATAGVAGLASTYFDGQFETGTDLAAQGWVDFVSGGTVSIDTNPVNNMFTHDGSNSLKVVMGSAFGRGAAQSEYLYKRVALDATAAGGDDNRGDGIYSMTAWVKTDAGAVKDLPGVMIGMADLNFMNVPFADIGYVALPLGGAGWKQVHCSSARMDAGRFQIFLSVRADLPIPPVRAAYWGSFALAGNEPGLEADAFVFVDEIQIHKVDDDVMYFDRSVFPSTD